MVIERRPKKKKRITEFVSDDIVRAVLEKNWPVSNDVLFTRKASPGQIKMWEKITGLKNKINESTEDTSTTSQNVTND